MFVLPVNAASDLMRNTIDAQFSLFSNASKNFSNALLQVGELNLQASHKLMEESTAALENGMQLKTLTGTHSFIMEQAQKLAGKVYGYQQHMQSIATENGIGLGHFFSAQPPTQAVQPGHVHDEAAGKNAAPYEAEHRPSPLVEKLIASVVNDKDEPREQP